MSKYTLIRSRKAAFLSQSGRCFYCKKPMWQSDPEEFSRAHGMSLRIAKQYQCTAEHLVARQDGGRDARENIVAACVFCNRGRHRMTLAPPPEQFQKIVIKRISQGRWN